MDRNVLAEPTPGLHALVGRVHEILASAPAESDVAHVVASAIRPALRAPDLLRPEHEVGSPDGYRQHVLWVEPDGTFSVVALVWLPGQYTPIHDHVSWCAVGVHRGEETELRYRLTDAGAGQRLEITGRAVNEAGSVSGVTPPGDIHKVMNTGADVAVSIHVYGADIARLGSSVRRCYDLPVGA